MTARAHVTLRIAAVFWIVALLLLPRWGASASQPDAVASPPPPPAAHAHKLAPSAHGPALAKR